MHDLRKLVGAACLLAPFLTCSNFGPGSALAAEPARSTYITDVRIEMSTLRRLADESDNFHLTWHSDDALYGAYGDGWGFVRSDIPKRAIGVSRVTGTPPQLTGREVWEGSAQGGSLLLGGLERQVVGDALDRRPSPHVVHARAAARARVPGGADRHLPRRRQDLAQGGLGVHPPGPDADAQLPADRQGAPRGGAARCRHGLCLQLPQPAGGLARRRSRRRAGST